MIRWKLFLSVSLIVGLLLFFFILRFDAWLTNRLEGAISGVTGTKTDILSLKTKFFPPRLEVKTLEIASSTESLKNLLEFEDIVVAFELLPLLEKRVVINEFSIRGMDWGTPRKNSGFLPPKKKEPSWLDPYVAKAFGAFQQEFEALPLSRLADFRIPDEPEEVLALLDLESEAAFREAAAKFEDAQTRWKTQIRELRDLRDYEKFIADARAATKNIPKTPQEVARRVQTVKTSIDFFKREKEKAETLLQASQEQWTELETTYAQAKDALQTDFENAKNLVSLDELNVENLSRLLFGPHWLSRAEQFMYYQNWIRQSFEKIRGPEKDSVEIRQRAKGRDIQFVVPEVKPGFVWEFSEFSVTGLEREVGDRLSQSYSMKIQDVTSSPRLHGKPTQIDVGGRFRESFLATADFQVFLDYTDPRNTQDRYQLKAEDIQASLFPVGVPRVFPLKISEGLFDAVSEFKREEDKMRWLSRLSFSGVDWDLREIPQIGFLIPSLSRVLGGVSKFYVEIEFIREADGLRFLVRSDLDQKLKDAVFGELEKRLEEFYKQLRQVLNQKVARVREHADRELQTYRTQIVDELAQKEKLAKGYLGEAERQLKELENQAKAQADRLKKEAENAAKKKAKEAAGGAVDQLRKSLPKSPF
jgi:uncharacterized protein (TIGR03545 family)